MPTDTTLAELLRLVIVMGALAISIWALIDDAWDLINVRRYGELGGPRWISAMEHLLFNSTLLIGWCCYLGVVAIAISLPPRSNLSEDARATIAGWLNLIYGGCVLVAQVHRRIGRVKLRQLPLEAWERMLTSMVDGLSPADRTAISQRLLTATAAGRELGHLIANELSPPVGLIDMVLQTATLSAQERADLEHARDHILVVSARAPSLHAAIREQVKE